MPNLSVFLIGYNEEAHIEDCLYRVHEGVVVDGSTAVLKHDLLQDMDQHLDNTFRKYHNYTTLAVQGLFQEGLRPRPGDIVLRQPIWFLRTLLIKAGFLDGRHGLILFGLSDSCVFPGYAELWKLQAKSRWEEVFP